MGARRVLVAEEGGEGKEGLPVVSSTGEMVADSSSMGVEEMAGRRR